MASFVPAQFSNFSRFNFEGVDNIGTWKTRYNTLRPISDFFDFRRVSRPTSIYEVQNRVLFNLSYFHSNYLLILILLSAYTLFTNLWLLFDLVFIGASIYAISLLNHNDLILGSIHVSTSQLYTLVGLVGLPILFLSSPMLTIFWLATSCGFVVFSHAALLEKPVEVAFNDSV